jgi:hypothetical protein
VVQLGEALRGERAAVRPLEVAEHPLLAVEVDEADAVLVLVALQPGDELQPLVHELDQRAVEVGDLPAGADDERVVRLRRRHVLESSHAPTSLWPS